MKCIFCAHLIEPVEPSLSFNNCIICFECYIKIIPEIYKMAGYGDGGIIHLVFNDCLHSTHNRSKRVQIRNYRSTLKKLLHKYNFKCVGCGDKEKLTIDHIKPVSKGGTDDVSNLQILCSRCNRVKGVS